MIVTCPNCSTKYNLPDDRIPAGGAKVKCSRCSHVFKAEPPAPMPEEEVETLLEQEEPTPEKAPAEDTDKAFDEAFEEMAGGESAEPEAPAEHGGDVFADDDAPSEEDFDSLFDEPAGSADEAEAETAAQEPSAGDDIDDLFGDDEPAKEPAPAAEPEEEGHDFDDLFGEEEPDEAAPAPASEDASEDAGEDDLSDLFGDDEPEEEPAAPAAEAPEDEDLEGGLFDEEGESEDVFGGGADEGADLDEEEDEEDDSDFDTDFDLDEEEPKSGKGKWIAIIVILLLAGGIGAGWYFKAWKFFGIDPASTFKDVPVIGSLFGDQPADDAPLSPEEKIKHIELKNVRQYYVQNEKAGLVFVVQGDAVNSFDAPRERIEVEVFLYDANGNVLTSQRVMCGNSLSMFQLRVQSQKEIEDGLASEVGILSNNTFLRPGASTPFMAAIFNAPADKVKEFGVKVVDVQKPE